jgi:hypothetical protein
MPAAEWYKTDNPKAKLVALGKEEDRNEYLIGHIQLPASKLNMYFASTMKIKNEPFNLKICPQL